MRALLCVAVVLLLAACVPIPPQAPTAMSTPLPPLAVEYNLGETTITQAQFPEDSRFRHMPVRLNGVIAAPTAGEGPFPVILILHGTHPGCPEVNEVDRWPCSPEDERNNYRGFSYLAQQLAAGGYVALSININAENTFGFGEPKPGERLIQIVDAHLAALETASAGGENKFGLDLRGMVDKDRIGVIGHSRGGEMALMLAREGRAEARPTIDGVLQVAPSPVSVDPADGSPVPLAVILPMCDGDVTGQDGQHFYEGARQSPGQKEWVASAFLEGANHNGFNTILGSDPFGVRARPDCEELLDPQTQQAFLSAYAMIFFDAVFGERPEIAQGLLGLDAQAPAPHSLGGLEARVAALYPAEQRTALFTPLAADELATNRLGGAVVADGVTTFFCEAGYYTPAVKPGSEPCRRANVPVPGDPALAVVTWQTPGSLRFAIPEDAPGGNLSEASAISLRAAVDPLSPLNPPGQNQALSVRLTDGEGRTATARTRADEPALRFPPGEVEPDDMFGELFTGRAPLTTLRVPLSQFGNVDLTDVREVALVFEGTGSLFLGDLEWVK